MRILIPLSLFLSFFYSNSIGQTANPQGTELPSMTLEAAGFNRDSIDHLVDLIWDSDHRDFRGMVVIKDNHLVLEEYFHTFMRMSILDIRSAGKSITALLLGVAIKDGLIESLDQSVYSLFSEAKNSFIHPDYKKITLRDLLDMSSGLDADTDRPETTGQAGNWISRDDWKAYLLNVPMTSKPGKNWVYADINAVLIGLAIEEASGMSLRDYAIEKLFTPLGIEQLYWYTNASNQTGAAGNLYLSTLDFAKLGLVIINEGKWGDRQFIDPAFIKELIEHKKFDLSPFADSYGMLWYKSSKKVGKKNIEYLFASGNGGNHLIVIPEEEMIIALTSSAYGPGHGQGRSLTILSMLLSAYE